MQIPIIPDLSPLGFSLLGIVMAVQAERLAEETEDAWLRMYHEGHPMKGKVVYIFRYGCSLFALLGIYGFIVKL